MNYRQKRLTFRLNQFGTTGCFHFYFKHGIPPSRKFSIKNHRILPLGQKRYFTRKIDSPDQVPVFIEKLHLSAIIEL